MTIRSLLLGSVLGAGAGVATSFWIFRRKEAPPLPVSPTSGGVSADALAAHPALRHGMPVGDPLRVFSNFVLQFDTRLRNPKWVLEHISAEKLKQRGGDRKNSNFVEDAGIDPRFRSRLESYRRSGFDRGHMAPAANHKQSQETMDETFSLSNMSPQVGEGFNRDFWARFERWCQDLTRACADVYIVTGPLYLPQRSAAADPAAWVAATPLLGAPPQLMAVPSHFFKARRSRPFASLEEVAGLQFFPGYLTDGRRQALDAAALAWQRVGQAQLRGIKGGATPLLLPAPPEAAAVAQAPAARQQGAGAALVPATDRRLGAGTVHVLIARNACDTYLLLNLLLTLLAWLPGAIHAVWVVCERRQEDGTYYAGVAHATGYEPLTRPGGNNMTAAMQATCATTRAIFGVTRRAQAPRRAVQPVRATAAPAQEVDDLGFRLMRKGVKQASPDTILTPRFYTTDFDEMEDLFSLQKNPNIPVEELVACLEEFRRDYNQKHFVRNDTFPAAAAKLQGATRKIFIEFLERSCTAEFSGFLLYKELGRRLKDSCPAVAEIFTLLSRDEARHAGFINKSMSGEEGGEGGRGEEACLWSRFFCLSVYVTMYLNDHQRDAFYRLLGMSTDEFDRHVIVETNKTTERIFPEVPDLDAPSFWPIMDEILAANNKLCEIDNNGAPEFVRSLQKLPYTERVLAGCIRLFFGPVKKVGSLDMEPEMEKNWVY
eukprot:scaffold23.g4193.t1